MYDRVEDINQGVSLACALFHLDIQGLTLDLVHHVVPQILQLPDSHLKKIVDPRGKALTRLAVMCLSVCHRVKTLTEKGNLGIYPRISLRLSTFFQGSPHYRPCCLVLFV